MVHTYPGLPPVAELILEAKTGPGQHGAEMPSDNQLFVAINVVKSLAMNKPKKMLGLDHI